mgnify:CR=1 FL=1
MPVFRACVIECDACESEVVGKMISSGFETFDILHPDGWTVYGSSAYCPKCSTPAEVDIPSDSASINAEKEK